MFMYFDDNNESDIEVLTSDPSDHVRYSNQPSVDQEGNAIAASSNDVSLPAGVRWTAWNEHRMDWLPGRSAWYVNGISVSNLTYGVPTKPSGLVLNAWSDGGVWSGNMSVGDQAYLEIQWIEMVFNTSGPAGGSSGAPHPTQGTRGAADLNKRKDHHGCKTPCAVDGVKTVGFPESVGKPTANAAGPAARFLADTLAFVADLHLCLTLISIVLGIA